MRNFKIFLLLAAMLLFFFSCATVIIPESDNPWVNNDNMMYIYNCDDLPSDELGNLNITLTPIYNRLGLILQFPIRYYSLDFYEDDIEILYSIVDKYFEWNKTAIENNVESFSEEIITMRNFNDHYSVDKSGNRQLVLKSFYGRYLEVKESEIPYDKRYSHSYSHEIRVYFIRERNESSLVFELPGSEYSLDTGARFTITEDAMNNLKEFTSREMIIQKIYQAKEKIQKAKNEIIESEEKKESIDSLFN